MKRLNKKIIVLLLLFIVIFSYAIIQGKKIIDGPIIEITSPINGETYLKPLLEIKGLAFNIEKIHINDNPIFIDKDGNFSEKLMLFKGYNIIIVDGEDKFGKKTNEKIEVICKCEE